MWKWLRSWFAWRFSLRRLVVATVFLGAVVGLNLRKIGPLAEKNSALCCYWGWPLPVWTEWDMVWLKAVYDRHDKIRNLSENEVRSLDMEQAARYVAARRNQIPFTHLSYHALGRSELVDSGNGKVFFLYGIIDAAIVVLLPILILFVHVPCLRASPPPSPPPARAGG